MLVMEVLIEELMEVFMLLLLDNPMVLLPVAPIPPGVKLLLSIGVLPPFTLVLGNVVLLIVLFK